MEKLKNYRDELLKYNGCNKKAPGACLQGLMGVKNEGQILSSFTWQIYKLQNVVSSRFCHMVITIYLTYNYQLWYLHFKQSFDISEIRQCDILCSKNISNTLKKEQSWDA